MVELQFSRMNKLTKNTQQSDANKMQHIPIIEETETGISHSKQILSAISNCKKFDTVHLKLHDIGLRFIQIGKKPSTLTLWSQK